MPNAVSASSFFQPRRPTHQQRDGGGLGVVCGLPRESFTVGADVKTSASEIRKIQLE
jgi:hypothetical protein